MVYIYMYFNGKNIFLLKTNSSNILSKGDILGSNESNFDKKKTYALFSVEFFIFISYIFTNKI